MNYQEPSAEQILELENLVLNKDPDYYLKLAEYTGANYGYLGYQAATNTEMPGIISNTFLKFNLEQIGREYTNSLRISIMNSLLSKDFELRSENWSSPLTGEDIAEYHYDVFENEYQVPRDAWTAYIFEEFGNSALWSLAGELFGGVPLSELELNNQNALRGFLEFAALASYDFFQFDKFIGGSESVLIEELGDLISIADDLIDNDEFYNQLNPRLRFFLDGLASVGRGLISVEEFIEEYIQKIGDTLDRLNPFCFPTGTPILIADGTEKPIEQIEVGNEVLAFDGFGELVSRRVIRTFKREDQELVQLGDIQVTPGHHFLTADGSFKAMSEIDLDGYLVGVTGKLIKHPGITPVEGKHTVYNFEVEELHTYVAGGYRVHNESLSTYQAVTNLGRIGSSLGGKIFTLVGDQDTATQLATEAVGSTFGGYVGDAINYEIENRPPLAAEALQNRLPGEITSTLVSFGNAALSNAIISNLDIDNEFAQIGVNTVTSAVTQNLFTDFVVSEFGEEAAVQYFGIPGEVDNLGNVSVEIPDIGNSLFNVGASQLGAYAGSEVYNLLIGRWNVFKEDVDADGVAIGGSVGSILGSFIPIPGVGTFIGSLAGSIIGNEIGRAIERWFDDDYPRSGARVNFDPNSGLFFINHPDNQDIESGHHPYALDGGNVELALEFATIAQHFLNDIRVAVGGEITNSTPFWYGTYQGQFMYQPHLPEWANAPGGSSLKGRILFDNAEDAVGEGILRQIASWELSGSSPYVSVPINLLPSYEDIRDGNAVSYDPSLDEFFADFQAAQEFELYKEAPVLYRDTIANITDEDVRNQLTDDFVASLRRVKKFNFGDWRLSREDRRIQGDLDGDGADDILIQNSEGNIGLLSFNSSLNKFQNNTIVFNELDDFSLSSDLQVYTGDFDGDGKDEGYFRQNHAAGFFEYDQFQGVLQITSSIPQHTIGQWGVNPTDQSLIGDFDGDGIEEIFTRSPRYAVLLAYNPATEEVEQKSELGIHRIEGWELDSDDDHYVGDFDGDGIEEVFVQSDDAALILSYDFITNRIVRDTEPTTDEIEGLPLDLANNYYTGDFDGDGTEELLAQSGDSIGVVQFDPFTGALLSSYQTVDNSLEGWELNSTDRYFVGDFDGDGKEDVFVRSDHYASLFTFDGESGTINRAANPANFSIDGWHLGGKDTHTVGDFNNDGVDEIYVQNEGFAGVFNFDAATGDLNFSNLTQDFITDAVYDDFGV